MGSESTDGWEDLQRSILEHLTELVVRWRPDGTRTYVNPAFEQLAGRPAAELIGCGDLAAFADRGWPGMVAVAAGLRPERPAAVVERRMIRARDGELIWFEWVDRGLFAPDGRLVEVQSVARDVSERRHAADAVLQERVLIEVLRDTALALNSTLDTGRLYERILAAAGWMIPHDTAAIVLVSGSSARVVRVRGWDPARMGPEPIRLALGEADRELLRGMAGSGRAVVVPDVRSSMFRSRPFLGLDWVGALATAPLFDEGRIVGILALLCEQPRTFRQAHVELIEGFACHATSAIRNARLFQEVSDGRAELRRLSERLVNAQEEERGHISRELHDEIGQTLTGMIMNADFVLTEKLDECPEFVADRLRDISAMAKATLKQIRGLSLRLRPTMLDALGLEATVQWLASAFSERSGICVTVEAGELDGELLDDSVTTTLYRCVQEALTNAARHGSPDEISVQLHRDGDVVRLSVSDDGSGFDTARLGPARPEGGVGITGMRERLAVIGGELAIYSSPGNGTLLVVEVPCPAEDVAC